MIDYELDGKDTSKKLIDIYSFSHITHGVLLHLLGFDIYTIIAIEMLWEWFENTDFIIKKYRKKEEYKNFTGDSFTNRFGDVLFTILGAYIAINCRNAAIGLCILLEIILYKYRANFLHLSVGSLI